MKRTIYRKHIEGSLVNERYEYIDYIKIIWYKFFILYSAIRTFKESLEWLKEKKYSFWTERSRGVKELLSFSRNGVIGLLRSGVLIRRGD
jgi:hypothetical protein